MTFLTWYISGLVLMGITTYLEFVLGSDKELKLSIGDILLFFVFALLGFFVAIAAICVFVESDYFKNVIKKNVVTFLKKPIRIMKKKEEL